MGVRITTLIENNQDATGLLCHEHGLSLFVEAYGLNILFDTGQSGQFVNNAKLLGKDLNTLDYIVLSHGHYDHSGGFEVLADTLTGRPKLIVGSEFFYKKYKIISDDEYKYNGNSFQEAYIQQKQFPLRKLKEDEYYLSEKIMIFNNFIRSTDFEPVNPKFIIKNNDIYCRDYFADEIALGINTSKGLVVIVGCSHAGIINILNTIQERTDLHIHAIIGGTHLVDADDNRLQRTLEELHHMDPELIAVSHCTGELGIRRLQDEFGGRFIYNNTGNILDLSN